MSQLYAERIWWSFSEPINTATNLAFLCAAFLAWKLARRHRVHSHSVRGLILLAVAVGVGSAVWHIFATAWAHPMDLVPILLFQFWFLWSYLRTCVGLGAGNAGACVFLYSLVCVFMLQVPPYFNGSILYAPTLLVLVALGVFHYVTKQPRRWSLLVGTCLFCCALVFRSIDLLSARYIPFGTHFLWHLLNGVLLYLAMASIILKQSQLATSPYGSSPIDPQ